MKNQSILGMLLIFLFIGSTSYGQKGKIKLDPYDIPEVTHVKLTDFPKGKVLPMIEGWGGMTVDINNAPAGTDFRPLLKGLKNDHCQVPHWGYLIEGSMLLEYENGEKETYVAGEAFYFPPGHTGEILEDVLLVSFSPEKGMKDLSVHLEKKVAQMNTK